MKKLLNQVVRRNAYFILTAAWMFTIAFIINNYWTNTNSVRYLGGSVQRYIHKQEKDFQEAIQDTGLLRKLIRSDYTKDDLTSITEKQYGFYIYEPDVYGLITLKFWNNQNALPDAEALSGKEKVGFVSLPNGQYEYINTQVNLHDTKLVVVGLIPVFKQYFIEIPNLKSEFVNQEDAEKRIYITQDSSDQPVKSLEGKTLFYLDARQPGDEPGTNWVSMTVIFIGVIFLLIFIHSLALSIAGTNNAARGILFLLTVIIILRGTTYVVPEILKLDQYDLFDPTVYSSGPILNSLGDLLINSLLFCWIVLFIKKVIGKRSLQPIKNTRWHWPVTVAILLLLVIITFACSDIIRSLIADGRISFNVTNFFTLTVDSFVGFFVLASLSFAFFFLSRVILRTLDPLIDNHKFWLFLIIAISGLLILSFLKNSTSVELRLYALIWLIIYVWLMRRKAISGLYSKLNISVVLFWLFIFSISTSILIMYENQNIEFDQRKGSAIKLSESADPSRERLLSIALTYLDDDFLSSNFERFRIAASNAYLKDSISRENFSPYLNLFDTRIFTFDSRRSPLFNEDPISYDTLNTIFQIQGKQTSVTNLRYIEKAFDRFSYIFKKAIPDTAGKTVGYFFILSDPRKYKADALVPELFKQNSALLPEYSPVYSYAIYNNLELFKYYNDYMFPSRLKPEDVPGEEIKRVKKGGYDVLWYKRGKDKVVLFARRDNYYIEAITLFAVIFSTFLLLVAAFSVLLLLIRSRLRLNVLRHYWQLNIRSQIHGTIIFVSLFSFIVIGIATVVFFNNRYEKNNQERLSKAIQIMAIDIQKKVSDQHAFDDKFKLYEAGAYESLVKLLNEVAEIHGAEINLYDLDGTLKVATNQVIYNEGILSGKMNPLAYYHLKNEQLIQFINQEQMGDLRYQSIYSPVLDSSRNAYAYLNIPSFVSQSELKREISNFLVTIIILNAFIILVAGVIALFITNRITSSFLLIGHKMREINLGKLNEEISWNRDDEIGGLVKEYNKMVVKLGESAIALAKSEREGAWREMARQVAHEIKNPLTPMKLSIQYLQKAIDNDSVKVKELSSNVAKTLIEQIDHLSKIAADFSQFANIGNVRNEVFDVHEMLYSLSSLYESTENLEFKWIPLHQRIFVLADKTQLNRLFTNLFQNAVEACYSKDIRVVSVKEEIRGDKVIIKISDTGDGIPLSMQSKIFTPNFTTKSSGTGLGLAMSKTIVEQAKGDIWFETEEGEGTTFFIKLPIIRAN